MPANDYFESLDQIAATLAHEVKNPISIVSANIDYLELVDEDKAHKKNYGVMRKELDRVYDLLQNFIAFNMPSNSFMEHVSLNLMLEEIVSAFECKSGCTIMLNLSQPDEELMVFCNRDKLQRAFTNFIKNAFEACEASPRTNCEVTIITALANDFVKVQIRDNGVGMDAPQIEKLKNTSFTTKKNGSGLGFQIASATIREHGGIITIDSVKNIGTTITVLLPFTQE